MPVLNGIDLSFSSPNFPAFKDAGAQVVMQYLSHTPAKNWTPDKVRSCHANGMGVIFGWETMADRALAGAAAGAADGAEAIAQIKSLITGLGYRPKSQIGCYAAIDFDAQPYQFPVLDAYMRAFAAATHSYDARGGSKVRLLARKAAAGRGTSGVLAGPYASASVVDHMAATGVSDIEWQTYAWSYGRLSPAADFYQWRNGQWIGGAQVDFNQIIHPLSLGAWWPSNSPYNTSAEAKPTNPEEIVMAKLSFKNRSELDAYIDQRTTRLGGPLERMVANSHLAVKAHRKVGRWSAKRFPAMFAATKAGQK